MAQLKNLNNRLKAAQRDGAGKSLLRASSRLPSAGFQAIHNQLLSEIPELAMITGPLSGLVGDIAGMFGRGKIQNAKMQAVQARTSSGGGSSRGNNNNVQGALNSIAQTNRKILKTTSSTAQNTANIQQLSFKQMVAARQAINDARQKEYQRKFAGQLKQGQAGDTKYKNKDSAEKAAEQKGFKDMMHNAMPEFMHEFGPALVVAFSGALKKLLLSPFALAGGLFSFLGKGGKGGAGVLKTIAEKSGKGIGSGLGSLMNWGSKKNAERITKLEKREQEIHRFYSGEQNLRLMRQGQRKRIREMELDSHVPREKIDTEKERLKMFDKHYEQRYGKGSEGFKKLQENIPGVKLEKGETFLKRLERLKVAQAAKAARAGHYKAIGGEIKKGFQPMKNLVFGSKDAAMDLATSPESVSKFKKMQLSLQSKGMLGIGADVTKVASRGVLGYVFRMLDFMIVPFVEGIWGSLSEIGKDPKEWDRLKDTLSEKGPAGIIHEFFAGKGNKIITSFGKGVVKGIWDITFGFAGDVIDFLVKQIFYLFGADEQLKTYESLKSILKAKASGVGSTLERWKDKVFGDSSTSLPSSVVQQQRQNDAYHAAKEEQKSSSSQPIIQNNINNSSAPTYVNAAPPMPVNTDTRFAPGDFF